MSYEVKFSTGASREQINTIMANIYFGEFPDPTMTAKETYTWYENGVFGVDVYDMESVRDALNQSGIAYTHDGPEI